MFSLAEVYVEIWPVVKRLVLILTGHWGRGSRLELVTLPLHIIRLDAGHARGLRSLDSVADLSDSIDEVGLLQPIIVQRAGDEYRLVAGYRRWLAASRAGKTEIPALILSSGACALQVQLAENLQREDLNPLERAQAIRTFMEANKLSIRAAAQKLGIPRTTLTDWLDILSVEHRFQQAVVDNFNGGDSPLTVSHLAEARALAAAMKSPGLATALLDAVLVYNLTKAETRAVARLVRENSDISIRDAVRTVRPHPDAIGEETDKGNELPPDEQNLVQLVRAMDQSAAVLKKLAHLSAKHLSLEQRQQLIERMRQVHAMTGAALDRLARSSESQPTARSSRKVKSRPSERRVS